MQIMSWSCWLRIASIAIAVLPVPRSPMISSRWPRPTFVIESMALIPVCSGSLTGWRAITPGALNSSGRVSVVSIGPWPSSGRPSGSTTRPRSASPTGTLTTLPVRFTGSPSRTCSQSPKSAAPTLSSSRFMARPTTPCSSSRSSRATALSRPWMRAMPSPTCSTVPTSARSVSTSKSAIRCLRIEVISSGRSFIRRSAPCGGEFLAKSLEAAAHARVEAHRSRLQDDAADQLRVDAARGLDGTAGRLLDLLDDVCGLGVGQLVGGGELDGQHPLLGCHERLVLPRDLRKLGRAALLRENPHEVAHELVGIAAEDVHEDGRLDVRVELGVHEHRVQVGHLLHGGGHVDDVVPDLVELARVARGLEERPRVHPVCDAQVCLSRTLKSSS